MGGGVRFGSVRFDSVVVQTVREQTRPRYMRYGQYYGRKDVQQGTQDFATFQFCNPSSFKCNSNTVPQQPRESAVQYYCTVRTVL